MTCQTCGKAIKAKKYGRPPKYCSDRCRKRQYDLVCCECGGRVDGTTPSRMTVRCGACALVQLIERTQAANDLRREEVEELWAQGIPAKEIATLMGWKESTVGPRITRLRKEGAYLPYRRNWPESSLEAVRRNGRKQARRLKAEREAA